MGAAGLREILDSLLLEGTVVARVIAFQPPSLFSIEEEPILPGPPPPLSSVFRTPGQQRCYFATTNFITSGGLQ